MSMEQDGEARQERKNNNMDGSNPWKKPRQHRREKNRMDGPDLINQLPDECILHIFSFLPSSRDRCSGAAVSKKWLILQAHMQSSDFKSHPKQAPLNLEISRCLQGRKANDIRLAAMVVGVGARGTLTQLCVRESFPSSSSTPHGFTDFGLKIIAQACPNLKSLTLWDCSQVGNNGLASIAQGCKALEKLELSNSPLIDDDGLIPIANNCLNLSTLILESCPLVRNRSIQVFAKYSSHLESISLVKCPLLGDLGVISLVSDLPKLEKLKLASMKVSDVLLKTLGERGKSIRVLCLEKIWGPTEMGYSWIGAVEKLDSLSLKSCAGLTRNSFAGLKKAAIRNCETLTDKGLIELTKSTQLLKSLKLKNCTGITSRGLMEALANCSRTLKVLSLVKCDLSGEEQQEQEQVQVEDPPLLDTLKLKDCYGITDPFLSWIGVACKQAKQIRLVGMSSITDRGLFSLLKPLQSSNKIRSLEVSGCLGIRDWSVLAITRAFGEKLVSLRLGGCKGLSDWSLEIIGQLCPSLQELDLSGCEISDGGVLWLARSERQSLQVLSLAGCSGITDKSLGFLEVMCGGLVGLDLKNCSGLSQEGIDSVRDTLWWCDLIS